MNLPPQKKWQKKNRLSINPFSSLDYISRPFQPLPGVFLWANNKGAFPVPPGKTPINNLMKDRTSLTLRSDLTDLLGKAVKEKVSLPFLSSIIPRYTMEARHSVPTEEIRRPRMARSKSSKRSSGSSRPTDRRRSPSVTPRLARSDGGIAAWDILAG